MPVGSGVRLSVESHVLTDETRIGIAYYSRDRPAGHLTLFSCHPCSIEPGCPWHRLEF